MVTKNYKNWYRTVCHLEPELELETAPAKKYRKLEPLQKRTASNRNPVRKKLPFLSMKAVRMSKVQFQPSRAVNPHSFYADPDPAVLLNADGSGSRSRSSLTKFEEKKIMKSFLKL